MKHRNVVPGLLQHKCLLLCLTGVLATFFLLSANPWKWSRKQQGSSSGQVVETTTDIEPPVGLNFFRPTRLFRENLRNGTYYVTTWATAGLTNEFISYMHLIYLGFLSDRVPILPPFVPHEHIPWSAGALGFGSVFNVTRVRNRLHMPILEWSEIKQLPNIPASAEDDPYFNPNIEAIGCWTATDSTNIHPFGTQNTERLLGLDVSYTRVPESSRFFPNNPKDPSVKFNWLTATITPNHTYTPKHPYTLMSPSKSGSRLLPNEHLSCFDSLYYATSGVEFMEWQFEWSPAWRRVGTYLRFTDNLIELTNGYLRKAFRFSPEEAIPPIITVHIRRGDFVHQCGNDGKACLIDTQKFVHAVRVVRQRLSDEQGLDISHIFVTSDEQDPAFWKSIDELGWRYINHQQELTVERFGEWYPPVIDTVALSLGTGFVGTDQSTFSTLSAWRVKDWNKGVATLVTRED